ncbi:MAG: hypothetical protein AB7O37_19695 [Vicinamibacteria bacterium]
MRRKALFALLMLAAAAGLLYWRWPPAPLPPPPTEAELEALSERRDALQTRLREIIVANGEKSLAEAPVGDVMIGIPTSFTRTVIQQVTAGLFDDMTLTIENLKVHKEGDVKVKLLFGRKTVGHYVLDVQIHRVQGTLKPGPPAVEFSKDRVAIRLPVKLAAGTGNADVRLQWDSKGLVANSVCGDTDVTKAVTGAVIPQDYVLNGAFRIASAGEAIVLRPDFREELRVKILVDPSEQAWQAVQEVVKQQRAGCEAALNKIDIQEVLANIVGRGFDVKIPATVIKPIRLPAGIRQSLEMQGIRVALQVRATGLKVTSGRLWYGANVALEMSKPTRVPTSP